MATPLPPNVNPRTATVYMYVHVCMSGQQLKTHPELVKMSFRQLFRTFIENKVS